ncbi:hypothetical protein E4U42_002632 [Claviceps africana]|uniref:SH3 domain-containing protein n=1 Tax=Claviceps africana TaxID=83212 RepID=A0A8K0NLZ0_9HYPO|nr:hypothetical protein E4U42_002632 [Claviceps africana]
MDTVDELAVMPFREVVEKGKQAIENAEDSPDMMKEALRLVRAGERSLARIESSCKKLYNEYGNHFIIALKENKEITEYRTQLTNLLWDFEDYIEADTFDAGKFHELQALNREAAPKIYDILITMKLEVPAHLLSHLSPPSSPHPPSPSFASEPTLRQPSVLFSSARGSMSGSHGDAASVTDSSHVNDAAAQVRTFTFDQDQSGAQIPVPGEACLVSGGEEIAISTPSEHVLQMPPRRPSLDPWDPKSVPGWQETKMDACGPAAVDRRLAVLAPESPVDPAVSPLSSGLRRSLSVAAYRSLENVVSTTPDQGTDECSDYRYSGSSTQSHATNATSQGTGPQTPTFSPIPEEDLPRKTDKSVYGTRQLQVRLPSPPPLPPKSPERSATSRVEDMDRQYRAIKQLQGTSWTGQVPALSEPEPANSSDRHERDANNNGQNLNFHHAASTLMDQPGLEVAVTMPAEDPDHGLIPVETEVSSVGLSATLSPRDCTIGPKSTFYQYKGFCIGAQEVARGEIGVKKTKKPGFSTAATVARCTHCLYGLDFAQLEDDVNKEDAGNFQKSGINYRLRFLQKCHLPAKRFDDVLYACIFCVQAGRTIDECDATVFTSSKALFNHLARHPRPLPDVAGIAVVDGDSMPAHLHNDYDIQFLKAPEAHPAQLDLFRISRRATGTAQDQSRKLFGQRLPLDRSPALELCHGARLVGIEWPERYNGEWIFAWHDGIHAYAPADIIKLHVPPWEDIRMVNSNLLRAKSRWKFQQKEKDKDQAIWLKFDKNETITNISYADPEFWCWSGTNSKGKWGIFPKVFLEPSTIQELTSEGPDRALTLTNEKNKPSSMLGKFSLKRRTSSARPPSVAESIDSQGTTNSYFASWSSRPKNTML